MNAGNKSIGVPGVAIVFGNGVPVVFYSFEDGPQKWRKKWGKIKSPVTVASDPVLPRANQ